MSEYQYYEFQTADRRLSEKEMQELRSYSTRAAITPTSFSNEYSPSRQGSESDFARRLALLREAHSRKPTFIQRPQAKGL